MQRNATAAFLCGQGGRDLDGPGQYQLTLGQLRPGDEHDPAPTWVWIDMMRATSSIGLGSKSATAPLHQRSNWRLMMGEAGTCVRSTGPAVGKRPVSALSSRFGDCCRWPTVGIHAVAASRAGQSALAVGPRCHDRPQPDVVNGTSALLSVLGNPVNGGFMPQVVHRAQARPGEKQQAANPSLVPRARRCSPLLHS